MKTSLRITIIILAMSLFLAACSGQTQKDEFIVGIIVTRPGEDLIVNGFLEGMTEFGYVEGENITYIREQTNNEIDDIEAIVERMQAQNVNLILSRGTTLSVNLRTVMAENDVPVVFVPVHDSVELGIVESIINPGANFTGVFSSRLTDKRLEWLLRLAPNTSNIFVINHSDDPNIVEEMEELQAAADEQGATLIIAEASSSEDIPTLLSEIPEEADAIYILPANFFHEHLPQFITIALARGLPLMSTQAVENGVLLNFGATSRGFGLQTSRLADQILRGIAPADLPVESADAFLRVNVQTAETIGLDIPSDILDQADEIIRETIFIEEFEVEEEVQHGHGTDDGQEDEQSHGD